ncbi:hypothetical protein DID78_03120 [Candidatus Marinamargulisbacteria bacterium SCGC AG-343-D04]|nr:hypothetical protein DID78_03120 [Candidatus Marinamargulisbacteria bacterium SCGC AG-343-D04]
MDEVRILQKHYNTLIKQGFDNLPYESGGFLGGKEGTILAILPTFNKDWDVNKDVFALHDADMQRAHSFFQKHNCEYFGVYHTHPEGIAYPSEQDINTGQKYHFIISYKNKDQPEFKVFEIINRVPKNLPLLVIPNEGFSSKELKGKKKNGQEEVRTSEKEGLENRIWNIIDDKPNIYEKKPPKDELDNSQFSTFA